MGARRIRRRRTMLSVVFGLLLVVPIASAAVARRPEVSLRAEPGPTPSPMPSDATWTRPEMLREEVAAPEEIVDPTEEPPPAEVAPPEDLTDPEPSPEPPPIIDPPPDGGPDPGPGPGSGPDPGPGPEPGPGAGPIPGPGPDPGPGPGPGDPELPEVGVLDVDNFAESYDRALAEAELEHGFASQLVENEANTFTATVSLAPLDTVPEEVLDVGLENDARLIADCSPECEFDVFPSEPIRKRFRPGVRSLTWDWRVVPRVTGTTALTLEIQPVLILEGEGVSLNRINEPIEIEVDVHPNRAALNEVLSAVNGLALEVPESLTVGETRDVTATLPLPGDVTAVEVDLLMTSSDRSAPATIRSGPSRQVDGNLMAEWTVTPEGSGPVDLLFTLEARTQAGDQALTGEGSVRRALRAVAPPPSLTSRLLAIVAGLTAVGTLITLVLKLHSDWAKRRGGDADAAEAD
jgi:hypothetical protein